MNKIRINKILIALDYDPTAQKSEPVHYSSRAYSPVMGFSGYVDMDPIQLDSVDGLKNASRDYLNTIKKHLHDESIQVQVERGDIAETINRTENL